MLLHGRRLTAPTCGPAVACTEQGVKGSGVVLNEPLLNLEWGTLPRHGATEGLSVSHAGAQVVTRKRARGCEPRAESTREEVEETTVAQRSALRASSTQVACHRTRQRVPPTSKGTWVVPRAHRGSHMRSGDIRRWQVDTHSADTGSSDRRNARSGKRCFGVVRGAPDRHNPRACKVQCDEPRGSVSASLLVDLHVMDGTECRNLPVLLRDGT